MLDINDLNLSGYSYTTKCNDPCIIVIHDFLSDAEITSLLTTCSNRFDRSFVVGDQDATSIHDQRTSSTCMLLKGETPIIASLEERVAKITNLDKAYQEPFQLVKYEQHQQYAPHYDFFDVARPYGKKDVLLRGQRCLTILAYLMEPLSGGSTFFPRTGIHVMPTKGSAVLWFNTDKSGTVDPRTEHGGMPVHDGVKIAMNIWIRDKHYI